MKHRTYTANEALGWAALSAVGMAAGIVIGWYLHQLEISRDPVLHALRNAPLDPEPLSPKERAALAAAHEELDRGEVVSWEEIKRDQRRISA